METGTKTEAEATTETHATETEATTENSTGPDKMTRVLLVICGVVLLATVTTAGLWATGVLKPHRTQAVCSGPGPAGPPEYAALCAALNRPDLPALLGTPNDHVSNAAPGLSDGLAIAEVRLEHYVVAVSDAPWAVSSLGDSPNTERVTVLGHPAVASSGHALALFGGKDKQGPLTRNLTVATNPKDSTGKAYQFSLFRQDGGTPDDADLRRVAETVLPALPGWVPTQ
ncbi:DUF6215 domain-containing protein [Kitasatospora sp. NPDC057904]|uniref:DUF6215 domain-containing protein n=1 Tax=unclassified Kitasatospora TaxID=2633591 RepID=UPI0036DB142A